ncbi:MAG TPA: helix-turn-helix transcriptional regulator [Firmicutes bacterium]|nr:helix-turn-helix transcriptional regulator [Candidatus Fermentithermobacillaceae bacterium]
MSTFGKWLRETRIKRGFSVRKLAMAAGIGEAYLSQIETGQRGVPSARILKKLAGPLGVTEEEIMRKAGYLEPSEKSPAVDWTYRFPPDLQEFIRKETQEGYVYLRLARDIREKDIDPLDVQAVIEALQAVRKRWRAQ